MSQARHLVRCLAQSSCKSNQTVAEQIGAIDDIGEWVLEKACRDIAELSDSILVAVNVSPKQFLRGKLVETVAAALATSGLPPERLEIEVTESVLADNTELIVTTLHALRARKIAVALDDFGTGYSSLSYLLNLPLDKIKIDKSFITSLPADAKANAVLGSILGVAKTLKLETIAEGVETIDQREALHKAGCHQGQGYLFSKPLDLQALRVFLHILDPASIRDTSGPLSSLFVANIPDDARQKISA